MKDLEFYREQHKLRLSYMPWLYFSLDEKHQRWARDWQAQWQAYLREVETLSIAENCFISPLARIFAEPGRAITIGTGSFIAADCVLHGPLTIGEQVSINHHTSLDGGSAGITIGDHSRLAAYTHIYAFNHGTEPGRPVHQQKTRSQGVSIGEDVWVGAHCGVTDGVRIGDRAVVGMNSTVTKSVLAGDYVAGNPAQSIGKRRD